MRAACSPLVLCLLLACGGPVTPVPHPVHDAGPSTTCDAGLLQQPDGSCASNCVAGTGTNLAHPDVCAPCPHGEVLVDAQCTQGCFSDNDCPVHQVCAGRFEPEGDCTTPGIDGDVCRALDATTPGQDPFRRACSQGLSCITTPGRDDEARCGTPSAHAGDACTVPGSLEHTVSGCVPPLVCSPSSRTCTPP